jgi:tetratricopeptide (TPR) repeat protein
MLHQSMNSKPFTGSGPDPSSGPPIGAVCRSCCVLLCFWLAGCGSVVPVTEQVQEDEVVRPTSAAAPTKGAASVVAEEIQPELLYAFLSGELAIQRGNKAAAVSHYLQAARISSDGEVARRAAQVAITVGDYPAAFEALRLWLQEESEAEDALRMSIYAASKQGDQARETDFTRRLLQRYRRDDADGAFDALANALVRTVDVATALRLLRGLALPDDAASQYALASLALHAGELEIAAAAAQRSIELRPDWLAARLLKGNVLVMQKQGDAAERYLAELVADYPDQQKPLLIYARLLVDQGKLETAYQLFERLAEMQPESKVSILAQAAVAQELKWWDVAERHYHELLNDAEYRDNAMLHLGEIAEARGMRDQARDWFARIGEKEQLAAGVNLARLMIEDGERVEAQERLLQLRRSMPDKAVQLYLVEGELLAASGHYQEAHDRYSQALEEWPDNHELLYARGLNALKLDRVDWLEQDLRKLLQLQPEHADALNALGYTLADQTDRYDEALALVSRALQLLPDNAAVLDSMGWVMFRLGRLVEARGFLQRAMQIQADAEIAAHYGALLWVMGDRAGAQAAWQRGRELDRDNPYLLRMLEEYGPK